MARNKHTLSHYRLLTADMGQLVPVGLVEVLPKDSFQHSTSVFLRMAPMAAPIMHPIVVRIHHFFVPHRLTWPDPGDGTGWESFITGGGQGDDAQNPPTHAIDANNGSLHDYFGLALVNDVSVSQLPTRCYNMIYNEWYRDQDLVPERLETDTSVGLVAWEKDNFTMARPFSQKGPAVTLPLGTQAPVKGIGPQAQTYGAGGATIYESDGTSRAYASQSQTDLQNLVYEENPSNPGFPGLYADLSSAEAIDINDFRRAFAIQRFQEARARYGSRYTEYLRYLGVAPADQRVQRPEFLAGGKTRIHTSEVLQTNNETGGAVERFGTGDMYGHGVASMRSNSYRRTFDEHGYVMSLLSVRPKSIYTQSIPRTFLRRDKEDFWQKELEQIGHQEVWGGEIFSEAGDTEADTYGTFGFNDRYQEYKSEQSRVSGEYRDILNYWHLGREFASRPVLNQSFTDCDPSDRIFNAQENHKLWIGAQHRLVARRLVRKSGASRIL